MHFSMYCMLILKTIILKTRLFEKCLKANKNYSQFSLIKLNSYKNLHFKLSKP